MFVRIACLAFAAVLATIGGISALLLIWDHVTGRNSISPTDFIFPIVSFVPILLLGPLWDASVKLWSRIVRSSAYQYLWIGIGVVLIGLGFGYLLGIIEISGGLLSNIILRIFGRHFGQAIIGVAIIAFGLAILREELRR